MPARLKSCFEIDVARPLDVAADVQIEVAVVVGVEPGGAGAPLVRRAGHTRVGADVAEPPADVAQQRVMPDRGDEEVDPAVVVVVAGGQPHAVGVERQTRRRRSVGEAAGAVVDEQRQRRGPGRRGPRRPRPRPAIDDQDVEVAVVVHVREAAAAAGGLGQQLLPLGAALALDRAQPGAGGHVCERRRRGRRAGPIARGRPRGNRRRVRPDAPGQHAGKHQRDDGGGTEQGSTGDHTHGEGLAGDGDGEVARDGAAARRWRS